MATTFGFYDLIETFPNPGCAVCRLLLADVHRLLDSILYEFVVEPAMQADFRASRGLCDEHGWQMRQMNSGLGVAKLYELPFKDVLQLLTSAAPDASPQTGLIRRLFQQSPSAALSETLEPEHPCIACKLLNASEAQYIAILSEHIADDRLRTAYAASDGLCLPHFRLALRQTQDADRSRLLIDLQAAIWSRLRAELDEFIRKSNFQYANETFGTEGTSWQRVVAALGGERGVFGLRRGNG